jgi:hypothetical protein
VAKGSPSRHEAAMAGQSQPLTAAIFALLLALHDGERHDQLGDARSFSLDSSRSRAPRFACRGGQPAGEEQVGSAPPPQGCGRWSVTLPVPVRWRRSPSRAGRRDALP